jgi:hypothetical protein
MGDAKQVTVENFERAETDMYFGNLVRRGKGIGQLEHQRALRAIDLPGVRPNQDTIYSEAIFDLDAGPVTLTLPDAGDRFMSLMVTNEDHYVTTVVYGHQPLTLTRESVGTRYVLAAIRTFLDPTDPADLERVHSLQDAITVDQPGGPGRFEVPNWDQASQKKVRDALFVLNETLPDLRHAAGARDEVDPVRHLIVTASGWGANPDKDAVYLNVTPADNDGNTRYRLRVHDVPVDGFWSITVYDSDGLLRKNDRQLYAINNVTAVPDVDGTIPVHFGGRTDDTPNCFPIFPGWNYLVRLYRPRPEILDGTYTFPTAEVVD